MYQSYLHFCYVLALETSAKCSSINSARVHDLCHAHSLVSLQLSSYSAATFMTTISHGPHFSPSVYTVDIGMSACLLVDIYRKFKLNGYENTYISNLHTWLNPNMCKLIYIDTQWTPHSSRPGLPPHAERQVLPLEHTYV